MVILNLSFIAVMWWICFFVILIFTYYISSIQSIVDYSEFNGFHWLFSPALETLKKYGCLGKGQFCLHIPSWVQKSVQVVSKVGPNQINGVITAGSVRL